MKSYTIMNAKNNSCAQPASGTSSGGRKSYVRPEMEVIPCRGMLLAASQAVSVHLRVPAFIDYYLYDGCIYFEVYSSKGYSNTEQIRFGDNPLGSPITTTDGCNFAAMLSAFRSVETQFLNDQLTADHDNRVCDNIGGTYNAYPFHSQEYEVNMAFLLGGVSFDGANWDAADFMANAEFDSCDGSTISGSYGGVAFSGTVEVGDGVLMHTTLAPSSPPPSWYTH